MKMCLSVMESTCCLSELKNSRICHHFRENLRLGTLQNITKPDINLKIKFHISRHVLAHKKVGQRNQTRHLQTFSAGWSRRVPL